MPLSISALIIPYLRGPLGGDFLKAPAIYKNPTEFWLQLLPPLLKRDVFFETIRVTDHKLRLHVALQSIFLPRR